MFKLKLLPYHTTVVLRYYPLLILESLLSLLLWSVPIMSASLNLFDDDDVGKSRRKNNTITNEGQASNLLMVGKESFKIRKTSQQPSTPMKTKPVVIYVVPPKVIHAEASEFMDVVQRLTAPMCSSSHDPQDDAQQRSNGN